MGRVVAGYLPLLVLVQSSGSIVGDFEIRLAVYADGEGMMRPRGRSGKMTMKKKTKMMVEVVLGCY